ncbi:unnamed protein product [Parnassius mnemosyne]
MNLVSLRKTFTNIKVYPWFQVSAWVTELVLTSTPEDRKATLACILRIALTCWNIGNFNGAMEIVAGLK